MKLSPPTKVIFWLATIIAALSIAGTLTAIPVISDNTYVLMTVAFVLLFLGSLLKGM
jgi:hypothetical protein